MKQQLIDWLNQLTALEIATWTGFAGFIAYSLSITLGTLVTSRSFAAPTKPFLRLHRLVAVLGFLLISAHIWAVLYGHLNHVVAEQLLFVRANPPAVLGVFAMWLAILIPLSFRLKQRKKISVNAWRNFHYFGYAIWILAICHALLAKNRTPSYEFATYIFLGLVVLGATWWRGHRGFKLSASEYVGSKVEIKRVRGIYAVTLLNKDGVPYTRTGTMTKWGAKRQAKRWLREPIAQTEIVKEKDV